MNSFRQFFCTVFLTCLAFASHATTITFDESPATNTGIPYTGPIAGATFGASNAGTWSGLANGDPGNWDLSGTNGDTFLGFNGGTYSQTVAFGSGISNVSVDFSRSNGSTDGMILLEAFDGLALVASTSAMLGAINEWTTLSLTSSNITSIVWSGTGSGFHPYGVDNLQFSDRAVPEPATLALMALGAIGLLRRRKPA